MKKISLIFCFCYAPFLKGEILYSSKREKIQLSSKKAHEKLEQTKKLKQEDSVYFRGDSLKVNFEKKVNHLKGNVFIQDESFSMKSEEAFLFYRETPKGREIERIEAFGNVSILKSKDENSEEVEAYSQKAYYYPLLDKLSLYEEAKIIRMKDIIEGREMHYNLKTEELLGEKVNGYVKKESSQKKS